MRRILLRVAYDGTAYSGWQLQPNGVTIEEKLNNALSELTKEDIRVIGAGRTDAGVHSMGNVAVFDTASRIPADKFAFALNQRLPEDIRIQQSIEVAEDFHPRKQNSRKTYAYKILNRTFELPLSRYDTYFYHGTLDLEAMQEAGKLLIGEHDFGAFCSSGSQAEDTIRRIYSLDVTKERDEITILVSGNGFLYNMVRIIAGTLLEVGCGRVTKEDVKTMLLKRERSEAGRKVPAKGLTMMSIEYIEETLPEEIHSDTWSYRISKEGEAIYIDLYDCQTEAEYQVLMGKLIHHAYRDGAKEVYAKGQRAMGHKIGVGEMAGHYIFEHTATEWLFARDTYEKS